MSTPRLNSDVVRGATVPGTNAGSYAPKANSAPGAAAALADPWASALPAGTISAPDLTPVIRDVDSDPFGTSYNPEATEYAELDHDRIQAEPDVGIMRGGAWYLYEATRKFPGTAGPHGSVLLTDTDSAVVAINERGARRDVVVDTSTPAWSHYAATGDPAHLTPLAADSDTAVAELFGHHPDGRHPVDETNAPDQFLSDDGEYEVYGRAEGLRTATVLRHHGTIVGIELGADVTYEIGF